MGVRRNAKYLSAPEIEDFVRACVLMKADIVNPAAPPAQRYGRWDEFVAVHRMIQNAFAPGSPGVNFGHGGTGAFSFFSWHRYFLYRLEVELQSHVPGVMLPYWDWTDPAPLMTDDFLGPDGDPGTQVVSSGYFAADTPGTGSNPTALPAWWPAGLDGWNLHSAFAPAWDGPLRRNVGGTLPTITDMQEALGMTTYATFQNAVESGNGLTSFPFQQMHNGLHGYIGGHMGNPTASPFDPIFYMHHCNIDRLWAMWQLDGHGDVYPVAGGNPEHHRNDIMYPWTGAVAGYGTNVNMAPIVMPDYGALGAQRNVDTLDHRALGYTYDTLPVVGVCLDRTGSMTQLTPDPMTTMAPDVTKWEAATRGVSAFLQDCEAAYTSKEAYVYAGVETFRTTGGAHQFTPVFGAATPSGLVKNGGSHGHGVFDAVVATMSPGGGTPLADALTHADAALVKAPFGDLPAGEQRYLAILTDGNRTTGSTVASIPAGSLGDTAVFAMGFGTGADVDYATLAQLVTKGTTLPLTQVFHGENAGTIDKFYTNSLAAAIGYTPIVDPVLELFAGEHTHVDFYATSAEDSFFITSQGMDFADPHWSFHLVAPDGSVVFGHSGHHGGHAGHAMPSVNAVRSNGRLSLFMQRDGAPAHVWVGRWQLMVSYKARDMAKMLMLSVGALLAPVSAGPVRGPRYFRPRNELGSRAAARLISRPNVHGLDLMPPFTTGDPDDACNAVVNIYARTRLRIDLLADAADAVRLRLEPEVLQGAISDVQAYGRLMSPRVDLAKLFAGGFDARTVRGAYLRQSRGLKYDSGKVLAKLESKDPERFRHDDRVLAFEVDGKGAGEAKVEVAPVPGVHHASVMVTGVYHPAGHGAHGHGHGDGQGHGDGARCKGPSPERFERVLMRTVAADER